MIRPINLEKPKAAVQEYNDIGILLNIEHYWVWFAQCTEYPGKNLWIK